MTAAQQRQILALFDQRKQQRMEIGWINEEPWQPQYQGREVKFKWNL